MRSTRAGILVLVDQGVVSAGNFAVGVLLGRLLIPEQYGAYTLAFGTLNALNVVQNALVINPLTVFGASRDGEALRRYYGGTLVAQVILSLALSLVSLGVAAVLTWTRPSLAPAFFALALLIGLDEGQEILRRCLLARLKAGAALANDSLYAGVRLGGILALSIAHQRGFAVPLSAPAALLCAGVGAAASVVLGLFQLRPLLEAPLAGFRAALRENWRFGRWNLAGNGSFALVSQFVPWLLAALEGEAALGALGACQSLVFVSNPLIGALATYWGPVTARSFSKGGVASLREATRKYAVVLFLVMGPLSAALAVGGSWLLHVVYSGRYDGYGVLFALLSLATFLSCFGKPQAAALHAMRRPDILFSSQILSLVLVPMIAWPAISRFGLMGYPIHAIATPIVMIVVRNRLIAKAEREAQARPGDIREAVAEAD